MTYPAPGRCGACHRPCEQYPSGRYRHTNGHACPGAGLFPITVPAPPKRFIPDGEPLPEPPFKGCWIPEYDPDDDFPTQLGWHSQKTIAGWWAAWRERVNAEHLARTEEM